MKISGSVNLIIVSALSHYIIYMYFLISVRSATCACVVENPEYLYIWAFSEKWCEHSVGRNIYYYGRTT